MRTSETVAWRRQARGATLQARLQAVVGTVPVCRVILRNGVCLYVQTPLSQAKGQPLWLVHQRTLHIV